jgi:hypothetical protein
MKGHMLNHVGAFKMGQIAAAVPAGAIAGCSGSVTAIWLLALGKTPIRRLAFPGGAFPGQAILKATNIPSFLCMEARTITLS